MRLQRLEISGFKSFPDRAELRFDDGVTAIVGPNGCGKSNLVDAITWVLGEQSARSLRGDRMEDVIFSGSDARKPTGAAEVRLLLAGVPALPASLRGNGHRRITGGNGHGPGTEVGPVSELGEADDGPTVVRDIEVGRRLYRSGESEYLIDGHACRLRDVQDLLMDAGVGLKAYAVIEQGKIGQILTGRPTERRQLIEEAAGVTKYKARRHQAELKLEAAQLNLTRIDDIIFELGKQRGALKRQAAKARRYRRLREELRRWEKVLYAHRYHALAHTIDTARARLAQAREQELAATAHLSEVDSQQARLRIELAEAESRATAAREAAHARELEIGRRQQQIEFDKQQVSALEAGTAEITMELEALEARCGPAHRELDARRAAAARAEAERAAAARLLDAEESAWVTARRDLEGLEGDVEAARSEIFAALNAATALRHAIEHASATQRRLAEELAKLDVETADLRIEAGKAEAERTAAVEARRRTQQALEASRVARAARESELASARIERDWRARELRGREQELAALAARLRSLEELDAARAGYGDGARAVLAESDGDGGHLGSIADYLEVDQRYERAVEACLGDLLQHVIVERYEQAAAGLRFVRERNAGRCGFLVIEGNGHRGPAPATSPLPLVPLASVVRINGPCAQVIREAIGQAWVAENFDQAAAAAREAEGLVATVAGDVFHGPCLVHGGGREEARGILATKREIKELRERIVIEQEALQRLAEEITAFDATIGQTETAMAAFDAERHKLEKALVAFDLQLTRASEEVERVTRKQELVDTERRRALEEQGGLDARQAEALAAIARIEAEQRVADEQFTQAQRRLFEAREALEAHGRRVSEAKAGHAALVERALALKGEVGRLEEAAGELDARMRARGEELERTTLRRQELLEGIATLQRRLDEDARGFDDLRSEVRAADERMGRLRTEVEAQEGRIREARHALDEVRAVVGHMDVARATAEADLVHLASSCLEAVHASLDEVVAEIDSLERTGEIQATTDLVGCDEEADVDEEAGSDADAGEAADEIVRPEEAPRVLTAEEAIEELRGKIDRLGPVNMMAIEQFDELEQRYSFLTAQRRDLVESISATHEAIKRIDRTTRERFREAFDAVNEHFQETFSTLFGGGRATLVLLDENDLLETGVDMIAQPPGKRLQNVQLLSGGEKALTAMALMFAIFKYRPSPFCLLDEIDAPLDDANIARFVEMLRGMQKHTQFVLITHNRMTMEIAERLYGVTMEEPGVSKLLSVELN